MAMAKTMTIKIGPMNLLDSRIIYLFSPFSMRTLPRHGKPYHAFTK